MTAQTPNFSAWVEYRSGKRLTLHAATGPEALRFMVTARAAGAVRTGYRRIWA